jgi:hypothetical protein
MSEAAPADAWRGVWGPESPAVAGVALVRDSGISVVPAVSSIVAPADASVLVGIEVAHEFSVPTALGLFSAGIQGVVFDPPVTPVIDTATIASVVATIPMPASATTLIVSARSESDLATRGYATIALEPTASKLPADLDGDGVVGASDLAIPLGAWE